MTLKNKMWLFASTLFIGGVFLTWWALESRPWEKEISIATSFEAFTGPYAGTEMLKKDHDQVILQIAITPAPWPEEAQKISWAARHGKIVHVSIPYEGSILHFDISGVTQSGALIIICKSEQEAKRIVAALKI